MRKIISLLFVLTFAMFFVSPVLADDGSALSNFGILEQLKAILEQAKILQQKIIDRQNFLDSIPYKINILYPNGGENFKTGETYNIRWDAVESGISKINLYLVKSTEVTDEKTPGILVGKDIPVDGSSFNWTVPTKAVGDGYYLLIRNSSFSKGFRVYDYSAGTFNVVTPDKAVSNINIKVPKGEETYITGRDYSITWSAAKGSERFVNVRLLKAGGSDTETEYVLGGFDDYILASDGKLSWKIPGSIPTGDYKLKIYGVNALCGESDATNISISNVFRIVNKADILNKITVVTPNGNEDLIAGVTQNISWVTPMDIENIDIYLVGFPSGTNYSIANNIYSGLVTGATEYNDWMPKASYGKDEKFVIRVCRANTSICGQSVKMFSILSEKPAPVPVVEPNTPEYKELKNLVGQIKDIVDGGSASEASDTSPDEADSIASLLLEGTSPSPAPAEVPVVKKSYLPFTFTERLSYGMTDSDAVRALQEALAKEGFFQHEVTGRFFDVTKKAVQDFQTKYGLDPSGSTGPGTQAKLNELYSK